jgi:hypothetical protein
MRENFDQVGGAYLQFYKQRGAGDGTVVYRGSRRLQRGDGIGDILRGVARFMLPVLFRGAKTFLGETLDANSRGASFADAAKGALAPTVSAMTKKVVRRVQKGNGQRRKRSRKTKQTGSGQTKRVYKRKRKSTNSKPAKQFGGSVKARKTKPRFGATNDSNF